MKCVINKLALYALSLQRGRVLPLCNHGPFNSFLQLTSGTVGVVGFLAGVKYAVTGFNNLKLM